MRNVGNVTNNMTFINTYLSPALIPATGKGIIETKDGQSIDWISSDIGTIDRTGFFFPRDNPFQQYNSQKFSFLIISKYHEILLKSKGQSG